MRLCYPKVPINGGLWDFGSDPAPLPLLLHRADMPNPPFYFLAGQTAPRLAQRSF